MNMLDKLSSAEIKLLRKKLRYWKKLYSLLENYMKLNPGDPDVYEDELVAYREWLKFKEKPEPTR